MFPNTRVRARHIGPLFVSCVVSLLCACQQSSTLTEGPPVREHPAPLGGGTLALTADGNKAIAADPDTDRVWIANLNAWELEKVITLDPQSEPGRIVAEDNQYADVVLRRTGEVARLDVQSGTVVSRTAVCDEPRGLAYDASSQHLFAVCMGGQLVSFTPTGEDLQTHQLDGDLRDVVVSKDGLWVSQFRSAELLKVSRDGTVTNRVQLPELTVTAKDGKTTQFIPETAWRMVPLPDGGVAVSHQGARQGQVTLNSGSMTSESPYGSPVQLRGSQTCDALVQSFVTVVGPDLSTRSMLVPGALPVDLTTHPQGGGWSVATAGSSGVTWADDSRLAAPNEVRCEQMRAELTNANTPVSVAYRPNGQIVMQARPGALVTPERGMLPFPVQGTVDRGFDVFHTAQRGNVLACASCHPEAMDDGRTWDFTEIGKRRTPELRGGISARAPYHWDGDLTTMDDLMKEVFVRRMGARLLHGDGDALTAWLDNVRALKTSPADPQAAERGRELFNSTETGCASCHSGQFFTNGARVDVGTGAAFKVPSLVGVGQRTNLMHDGCAATLSDRFGTCGGGDLHGKTSQLTPAQVDDLVSYLRSL